MALVNRKDWLENIWVYGLKTQIVKISLEIAQKNLKLRIKSREASLKIIHMYAVNLLWFGI